MMSPNETSPDSVIFEYLPILADSDLIHAQKITELCSKGPELEVDIALSNIGLDFIGQARLLYQLITEFSAEPTDEDQLAYFRNENEYKSNLLVELPNRDFAHTVLKQYFLDEFRNLLLTELGGLRETKVGVIADKALKENAYHLRFSKGWVLRLGDGTEVSRQKMKEALDFIYPYTFDLFIDTPAEKEAEKIGQGISPGRLEPEWKKRVEATLAEATLSLPTSDLRYTGGKEGCHTEYLGHILTELQFMQRTYPNLQW